MQKVNVFDHPTEMNFMAAVWCFLPKGGPCLWYWSRDWLGATKGIKALVAALPLGGIGVATYIGFNDVLATRVIAIIGLVLAAMTVILTIWQVS